MLKTFECYGFYYKVSGDGKVYGKNDIELKQRLNMDGYPTVTLGDKNIKRTTMSVHRIVALNYVENPFNKKEVNHIDGNKQNNHHTNLEWATRKEQVNHAFRIGLKKGLKGSENGRAVLSENQVLEIRKLHSEGVSRYRIAKNYNIGWTTVNHIIKRNTWKEI